MKSFAKVLNSSIVNAHVLLEKHIEAALEAIHESLVAEVLCCSRRNVRELRRLFTTKGECNSEFGLGFVLVLCDSKALEAYHIGMIECIGKEDDARSRPMCESLRFHHRL